MTPHHVLRDNSLPSSKLNELIAELPYQALSAKEIIVFHRKSDFEEVSITLQYLKVNEAVELLCESNHERNYTQG